MKREPTELKCGCGGDVERVTWYESDGHHGNDRYQQLQCTHRSCGMRSPRREGQYNADKHLEDLKEIWEMAFNQEGEKS